MYYRKNVIIIVFSIVFLIVCGRRTMADQSDFSANKRISSVQNIMIDSPNGKFRAIANFQEDKISIFEVEWYAGSGSIKIGIPKKEIWSIASGHVDLLGLSNDGEYLVLGDKSVALNFYHREKRINEVQLGKQGTKYLGFNIAGYYVIETLEGEKQMYDVTTGERYEFEHGMSLNRIFLLPQDGRFTAM